jgi:hypothetical protein
VNERQSKFFKRIRSIFQIRPDESMLVRTRARLTKKSDQKSVHILTSISSNTLRSYSENHRLRTIETRNPRAIRSDNSKIIPAITCKYPDTTQEKSNSCNNEELVLGTTCSTVKVGWLHAHTPTRSKRQKPSVRET